MFNDHSHSNTPNIREYVGKELQIERDSINLLQLKELNFQRFSKIYDHANTLLEPFPEGKVAQERIL